MSRFSRWVVFCLAALAFLAPLKFGTPVNLQSLVTPPEDFWDWAVHGSWPNQIGMLFAIGALVWLVLDSERMAARVDLLFFLPLLFLATQLPAALTTIAPQTTADTLISFAVNVLIFYAAAWYVRDGAAAERVFCGLGLAVLIIMVKTLVQYFGELQATREYAATYLDPASVPPDFLERLKSNRAYAWFAGYPNALAGFFVLAFAPTLAWIWVRGRSWAVSVKWLTLMLAGGVMVFCLTLTGSRGGIVAFAAMIMAGLFCLVLRGSQRTRWVVVGLLAVAAVFVMAQRGGLISLRTDSVTARGDYWRGAIAIARDFPWLGTGPGTFGSIYPKYKIAMTEEAQLVHNNFLQMWSDSGIGAFLVFALLWLVALRDAFALARQRVGDAAAIAICAALAGWTVHSLVDFDLYVPGLAMPAFLLLGTLQGLKDVPEAQTVRLRPHGRWVVAGACVAVVGSVWWLEGRTLLATFTHQQSHELQRVNPPAALAAAEQSIRYSPRNAHYHVAAGDLAVEVGKFDDAIRNYRAAIGCDPYRASYHWRLAQALAAMDHSDEILEQLRLAEKLNPTNPRYREDRAAAEESVRQAQPVLLESAPANQELDSSAANQ